MTIIADKVAKKIDNLQLKMIKAVSTKSDKWLDKSSMKKTIMFDNARLFLERISACNKYFRVSTFKCSFAFMPDEIKRYFIKHNCKNRTGNYQF